MRSQFNFRPSFPDEGAKLFHLRRIPHAGGVAQRDAGYAQGGNAPDQFQDALHRDFTVERTTDTVMLLK